MSTLPHNVFGNSAVGELDTESLALKEEILGAFSDVPCLDESSIADCMDPIEEKRCIKLLGGKRVSDWKDRPFEALEEGIHMTQLSFISDWAYRYYLPLYMLVAALHWDDADVLPEELISSFLKKDDPKLNTRFFVDRFERFTPRQLKAILSLLSYMKKRYYDAEHLHVYHEDLDKASESIQSLLDSRPTK